MDKIYRSKLNSIKPFSFDEEVTEVFDDMLDRSIPWYGELQRFIALLSDRFYLENTHFYDVGCSTGNSIIEIKNHLKRKINFIAIDKSPHMIKKAKEKCSHIENIEWICDGVENVEFRNSSIINMAYILQFVEVSKREEILERAYRGLLKNGLLILCEKTISGSRVFEDSFVDLYHDFKRRNGYSKLEIAQKKEALSKILIPQRVEDYEGILNRIGFRDIRILMKYLNFTVLVAVK